MESKRPEIARIEQSVIALLVSVVLIAVAYFKGADANARIQHRQEVKYGLQVILNALERGDGGRAAYVKNIGEITALIGEDPEQQRRLAHLDSLANLQLAGGSRENYYIDRIRAETNLMNAEETARIAGYERTFQFWKIIIAVFLLLATLTLLSGLFSLYRRIEPLIADLQLTKASLENANTNIAESLYKLKKEHGELPEMVPRPIPTAAAADDRFYQKLPLLTLPLEEVLGRKELFVSVPDDWYVVVVDVENSTQAVKNGLHHEVNLAATGSIVTVVNTLNRIDPELDEVPYFFGGDGVTFLLPATVVEPIYRALENYRHHVRRNLYLSLKVGGLSVEKVHLEGNDILLAKCRINDLLTLPTALGTGLKSAERRIKSYFLDETTFPDESPEPDLKGMECRWDEVPPQLRDQRVVCLVAECKDEGRQGPVYQELLQRIETTFGPYNERQPISTSRLKLDLTLAKVRQEMSVRLGHFTAVQLLKTWFYTAIGPLWFRYSDEGKAYLEQISQLSATLMIDGTFNCVINGNERQVRELTVFLDQLEAEGKLLYGIHVTHASVMSCFVEDRKDKHIHFVDGTEGGYTTAARMFKGKLL